MKKVMRLALAVALASPAGANAPDDQATLELGIRQAQEGDLSKALVTLDAVIQRLTPDATTRANELSQAHLYKGIAFVALAREEEAKAAFRDALHYDPALRLRKGDQPDRAVRVFEAARTGKTKSVLERPSDTPKKAGLGAGAIAAIVGGVALAGGAAVAVGGNGGTKANSPPGVTGLTVSPAGQALTGVTKLTFNATAVDPEGDPLTFTWNFGDGSSASGQSATHTYATDGSFTVQLTVSDGKGSATATGAATARSLNGQWLPDVPDGRTISITQDGARVGGQYQATNGGSCPQAGPMSGGLSDPRVVTFTARVGQCRTPQGGVFSAMTVDFRGTCDESLTRMSGTTTITYEFAGDTFIVTSTDVYVRQ